MDLQKKGTNQTNTIATYEAGVQKYIDRTPAEVAGELKEYIDSFLEKVSTDSDILEIGSATGRDADYIESKGYTVFRTDVTKGFVEYQRGQGKKIELYDALNGNVGKTFDLVIASAVFLHFNKEQFIQAVRNTVKHLNLGGYFAIALKQGEGEEVTNEKMDNPRYFKYWQGEDLRHILEVEGFHIEKITKSGDKKWLHCIAQWRQQKAT